MLLLLTTNVGFSLVNASLPRPFKLFAGQGCLETLNNIGTSHMSQSENATFGIRPKSEYWDIDHL